MRAASVNLTVGVVVGHREDLRQINLPDDLGARRDSYSAVRRNTRRLGKILVTQTEVDQAIEDCHQKAEGVPHAAKAGIGVPLAVIGVPSGAGTCGIGQEQTPSALRSAGLIGHLRRDGFNVTDLGDPEIVPSHSAASLALRRPG